MIIDQKFLKAQCPDLFCGGLYVFWCLIFFCRACRGALTGWAECAVTEVADAHAPAAGWQSASADKPCS